MDHWWGSNLEAEDNQLAWKMRRGVNGEADSKTDWSSFQSLKERKMKRLLGGFLFVSDLRL